MTRTSLAQDGNSLFEETLCWFGCRLFPRRQSGGEWVGRRGGRRTEVGGAGGLGASGVWVVGVGWGNPIPPSSPIQSCSIRGSSRACSLPSLPLFLPPSSSLSLFLSFSLTTYPAQAEKRLGRRGWCRSRRRIVVRVLVHTLDAVWRRSRMCACLCGRSASQCRPVSSFFATLTHSY